MFIQVKVDHANLNCFNTAMEDFEYKVFESKLDALRQHLADIQTHQKSHTAENQRLHEVVRLAEAELQKRRDQIHELEVEINELHQEKNEAKARVENAIDRLDQMMQGAKES